MNQSNQQFQSSDLQQSQKQNSSSSLQKINENMCSNKICSTYKHSRYNQTHQNNKQNLCEDCIQQFEKQYYCLYCKQIYFESTDDGKEWIMCDDCGKWVHTECADFFVANNNHSFSCIRCKKVETNQSGNQAFLMNRRANITRGGNNKLQEKRKGECLLNNFGFYWALEPQELAEDIDKLKKYLK